MSNNLEEENRKLREEILLLKQELKENKYKVLFEASPDVIVQLDREYRMMVCHIPGYPLDKLGGLKGKDIFTVTSEELREKMREALEKVFSSGETVRYESEGRVMNVYRYFHNYVAPIKDETGFIESAYFISRDVTTQKLSEKGILENERKLKALFGSSQHLHILMDLDQQLVWFNQRALETSRLLFTKPIEVGLRMCEFLRAEYRDRFNKDFERSKKGEVVIYERHYMIHEKSQSFYLEMMLQPMYENNVMTGISLVGVETTERKTNEEKLEKINHELVQQNQRLNQYSYIISHNLRGPIVTLLGLVTLFEQNKDDLFREEVIGHIRTSALHLDNIIKDLNLVLSQSGTDLHKTDVDLEEELSIVRDLLKGQIEEAALSLRVDFSKVKNMYTVKSFLQSILLNLMSNSIKYKRKDVPLQIAIHTEVTTDLYVCLTFADNGMGFDLEKNRDKVFHLYKRFHPQIEGKGLGLHLVKTQVELMAGKIEVESTIDQGTVFRIYLGI
ncbi:MAG TPA: PAS domain-containing sensor histidine kinase [Cytophagaceae bacterium]|nr:PAS domain-containing sensor histidine kinase [Cytophagaceae bacterium]